MNNEIKLKPCPFCGGNAKMVVSSVSSQAGAQEPTRYGACCDDCCVGTWKWYADKAEAAAAWNRRVEEDYCPDEALVKNCGTCIFFKRQQHYCPANDSLTIASNSGCPQWKFRRIDKKGETK